MKLYTTFPFLLCLPCCCFLTHLKFIPLDFNQHACRTHAIPCFSYCHLLLELDLEILVKVILWIRCLNAQQQTGIFLLYFYFYISMLINIFWINQWHKLVVVAVSWHEVRSFFFCNLCLPSKGKLSLFLLCGYCIF